MASEFAVSSRIRYAVEIVGLGRVLEHMSVMMWRGDERMATTLEAMVAAAKAVVPALTAEQVQAKVQAGEPFVILDVREKDEYDQGHIVQARLLPRGLLEFRINDVVPDKSTNILLH
jgi:hypothetical protein